jgi:hypothetical protein
MVCFTMGVEATAAVSDAFGLGNDIAPVLDGLPGLANRLGKCFLFVEAFPLAVVVKLDEMTQRLPGAVELSLGILVLDFDRKCLGHGLNVAALSCQVSSKMVNIR